MKKSCGIAVVAAVAAAAALALAACGRGQARSAAEAARPAAAGSGGPGPVLAVEPFLADMAQQVAGSRVTVRALMPSGVDPHSYEPTPRDVASVAESRLLIVNGAGMEGFLEKLLSSAGGSRTVVEASAGLTPRMSGSERDPHFFLDPARVVTYVENIRTGFSGFDPEGAPQYAANAASYTAQLKELDAWIRGEVAKIPEAQRMLVTNHESLGYFAERYGFRVVGTVLPGVSTEAAPSARRVADLVDTLKKTGARAVFLESGTDPALARQIAREAGIRVVTELYTHSLTDSSGPAPTYIAMMRYDTAAIVDALAGGSP
jgi:ABC-type Zn uptake system ZnuABC Zn-binding protein ZnuA